VHIAVSWDVVRRVRRVVGDKSWVGYVGISR
jgi:hypothetical protein